MESDDPASSANTVALVPAAGRGELLGDKGPEALVPVNGVPLVVHAVRGLLQAGCVRRVVVAAPPSATEHTRSVLSEASLDALVVPGGADRTESVCLALEAALGESPELEIVLVHDVVRALTPPALVRGVVDAVAAGAPAVVPVLPVADTVKRVDAHGVVTATVDRANLLTVQTPQGFRADVLRRCYASSAGPGTAVERAERLGLAVTTVPGHPRAMKITTPFDLTVAEALFGTPS
ncbi:IspD/TarI family cytidylyltransferase [Actinophytocola xanthii]|uniref:2-C-methyl-D-erythritol 4-phosphate cytidylyltransferase n=1 Tax=Actinophytocola xanthii TaxID=1912961 RepID=A0A1Q8C4G4_9PSEU|nr:2-C-methyl-D-erythritol 4-phosphate cytidylyltransferase [Actinophytocola xanthii]OLF09215.1 2-C-methyl-D-erythritol 4-phosphate cytidylyltransferase [Actinophytocola xanthii]